MIDLFQNFNFLGGIIVYFCVYPFKPFIRYYVNEKYHDFIFLFLAIVISCIYGILEKSILQGFEAFAGSQVIHALIKKGILSLWTGQK